MLGGWDRPEVARAQLELVLCELSHPGEVGPFAAFLWAMGQLPPFKRATLLDVGCGCGHYGILCERYFPKIVYTGTDASAAMIAEAGKLVPLGAFRVCPFEASRFDEYDIILASQVIEFTDDPPSALDMMLREAREFVILNRLRLTDRASEAFSETTYCGCVGHNWRWNEQEIMGIISKYDYVLARRDWDNQTTLVLKVNKWRVSNMR